MAIVHAAVIAVDDDDVRTVFNPAPIVDAVTGPDSATDGHIAVFSGTTGKIIADGGAPGGGGLLQTATFTLTDAQIKALPTTAIEIVAAQGANKIIFPQSALLYLNWAGDYDNIGSTATLGVEYDDSHSSCLAPLDEASNGQVSNLLIDGATHIALLPMRSLVVSPSLANSGIGQITDEPWSVNSALKVYASNTGSHTGDFTDGDTSNTLKIIVYYLVVDVS